MSEEEVLVPRTPQPPQLTQEELQEIATSTVRSARDSVWVIQDEIQKKTQRGELTAEGRGNIDRNVRHLMIVTTDQNVINLGGDISDLIQAIADGNAALE